jgi:hypothetical protein
MVDADYRNKAEDTALMHTLKISTSQHFEQGVLLLLSKHAFIQGIRTSL